MKHERTIRRFLDTGSTLTVINWTGVPRRLPDEEVVVWGKLKGEMFFYVLSTGMRCDSLEIDPGSLQHDDVYLRGRGTQRGLFIEFSLGVGIFEGQREEFNAWWQRYEEGKEFRAAMDRNIRIAEQLAENSPHPKPVPGRGTWDRMLINLNRGDNTFIVAGCLLFRIEEDRAVAGYFYPAAGLEYYGQDYARMVQQTDIHGVYEYLLDRAERGSIYAFALSVPERFERWILHELVRETFLEFHMV